MLQYFIALSLPRAQNYLSHKFHWEQLLHKIILEESVGLGIDSVNVNMNCGLQNVSSKIQS